MADSIKIGSLDISSFKVGSGDCKVYLGDTLLYPLSYKLVAKHSDLTEYKVACNASSVLSSAETKADSASASTRNVTIGDCVTELGAYSFNSFANLTGITLPSGLTTIGEKCFDSTHGITSITLPNSVVTINDSAFRHMHGLKQLNIPSGVTTIPSNCFNDCTALSSFTIPSNITAISGSAFSYCTALKEVHFQGTTPPVFGTNVFNGSTSIEKIYIPSCNNYDAYAAALPSYTDLIYGEDNTQCSPFKMRRYFIDGRSDEITCNSSSAVTSADTRSGYTVAQLTASTSGLSKVEIGNCATSISSYTFSAMTQLSSITLSNSVKTIANSGCMISDSSSAANRLHDISLGKVETIGNYAFRYCGRTYGTNQPKIKFPNTLTSIGEYAFHMGKYNELTFENGGNLAIDYAAFSGCSSYSGVSISTNSIKRLSGYTFANFTGLTSVSLSGVTYLERNLSRQFSNCHQLTDFELIGDGTIFIPQYFINGNSLTAITLGGISEISNTYGLNQGNNQASVRSLTMLDTTPPAIGETSISNYNPTVIYVPSSAVDTYKAASIWKTYASRIQAISSGKDEPDYDDWLG